MVKKGNLIFIIFILISCRKEKTIFNNSNEAGLSQNSSTVNRIGPKASYQPEKNLLQDIYNTTSEHAPAGVRPDPDTFIRNLVKIFRDDGTIIAQEMGRIEPFRQLLGGANEDFSIVPQDSYDATSLLALIEVLGQICQGLVDPVSWRHGTWKTILPNSAADINGNVNFLLKRFTAIESEEIFNKKKKNLVEIINTSAENKKLTYKHYVPACQAIFLDIEALLL